MTKLTQADIQAAVEMAHHHLDKYTFNTTEESRAIANALIALHGQREGLGKSSMTPKALAATRVSDYPTKPERLIRPSQIEDCIRDWIEQADELDPTGTNYGNEYAHTKAETLRQCADELRELL